MTDPHNAIPQQAGKDDSSLCFAFGNTAASMHEAFDRVSAWLAAQELPKSAVFKVRVIAEELMSNVTRHSEQDDSEAQADVSLRLTPTAIVFRLSAGGVPFNPIENRDMGYGLMITNGTADDISYERTADRNITTVTVEL